MSQRGMAFSQRDPMQKQLSKRIEALLRDSEPGDVINIADYVSIDWDKLCMFYEATSYEDINKTLGFKWIPANGYVFSSQYLVFVDGDTVTMHLPLAAPCFYVGDTASGRCVARENAVFRVDSITLATGEGIRKYFSLQE